MKIEEEHLSKNDLLTEAIFLGLRSRVGIDKTMLPKAYLERARTLVAENKLTETPERFYNPDFFIADALALYLLG